MTLGCCRSNDWQTTIWRHILSLERWCYKMICFGVQGDCAPPTVAFLDYKLQLLPASWW